MIFRVQIAKESVKCWLELEKWSILIVMTLASHPHRFSEIKRRINGISQRMLTLCLRGLERDGLVKRTVYPVVPPHVEYANRILSFSKFKLFVTS